MKGSYPPGTTLASRATRRAYVLMFVFMAFTGSGQMPIFARYYIADLPGMAWSADFYLTHYLHYLGACLFLTLLAYAALDYLLSGKRRFTLTGTAYVCIALLAGIVITGIFRVLKNLPDVVFSPAFTMFIDIAHLGFMILYILAALFSAIAKRRWLATKSTY
jgi:uncharacterized protein (DUF1810 family)